MSVYILYAIGCMRNSSDETLGSHPGAAVLPRLTTRGDR